MGNLKTFAIIAMMTNAHSRRDRPMSSFPCQSMHNKALIVNLRFSVTTIGQGACPLQTTRGGTLTSMSKSLSNVLTFCSSRKTSMPVMFPPLIVLLAHALAAIFTAFAFGDDARAEH